MYNLLYSFTEVATVSDVRVENLINYSEQIEEISDKLSSLYRFFSTSNIPFFLLMILFVCMCSLMFRGLWK